MRLDYRVLWIEDNDGWFEQTKDIIQLHVEGMGFNFFVTREKSSHGLDELDLSEFDLMCVDLKLEGLDNGNKVIDKLRHGEHYTEIVFYSAGGRRALEQSLSGHQVDGVFLAERSEFEEKTMGVIRSTIKKVLDVNNMRGIVMAETSDFDARMVALLKKIHSDLTPEAAASFVNEIRERIRESLGSKQEKLEQNTSIEVVDQTIFESYLKWRSLKSAVRSHPLDDEIKTMLNNYWEDVVIHRNRLAHVTETSDGKLMANGFEYDDEKFKDIRKSILRHRENFRKIRDSLER